MLENQLVQNYIDFTTKLRMGEGFSEELFSEIKSQLRAIGLGWSDENLIPKNIAYILASLIPDIESFAKYNHDLPVERVNQAIADTLELIDNLLDLE